MSASPAAARGNMQRRMNHTLIGDFGRAFCRSTKETIPDILDDTLDLDEQSPDDSLPSTPKSNEQFSGNVLHQVSGALDTLSKDKSREARDLSHLQSLDQVIQGSTASSMDKINITKRIQDLVMEALPEETLKALGTSHDSSSLALELVRRKLIGLDSLAHALYSSTEKQRSGDAGLGDLYSALLPAIEVRGALISAGIDVGSSDWATTFAEKMPNLRRLNSTPWHEVAILLKLIDVEDEASCGPWKNPPSRQETRIVQQMYAKCDGAPAIRQQVLGVRLGLDVADQLEEMGIYDATEITTEDTRRFADLAEKQLSEGDGTIPATAPKLATGDSSATAKIRWKRSSPTKLFNLRSKAAVREVVSKLNALASNASPEAVKISDEKAPDLEAEVAGLCQEKARLQETMDTVRKELDSVNVAGNAEEGLEKAKGALDAAKAAVAAGEGWQNRIDPGTADKIQASLQARRLIKMGKSGTGYSSNEELVARASGGAALYGLNIFPATEEAMVKPYTPVLETPTHVQMTGAVANFEAHVWQTTDIEAASSFHNVSDSAGTSVAKKVATSVGGSVSVGTPWASASVSVGTSHEEEDNASTMQSTDAKTSSSKTSSTATVVEYIMCPMKSFRIPVSRMRLSEDAYKTALDIDSIRDAEEFIDAFGSHVSNGRQEMGGIFYSTMVMTSCKEVNSSSLMEAASFQANQTKSDSMNVEASVGGGYGPVSGKVSSSFGKATSVGTAKVNTSATGKGNDESSVNARYSQYIRCTGPRATTPEIFAETLFDDNSSWAVIDRGPIEAFVPVSRLLRNTIELMNDDDSDRRPMQMSMYFIAAAWRNRAKNWAARRGYQIPQALLSVYQTSRQVSQGRVQSLIDSVYGALEFVKCENFAKYWEDEDTGGKTSGEAIGRKVASAILDAAHKVSGGRGVPALLQHLDADAGEVRGYVESMMKKKLRASMDTFYKIYPDRHDTGEPENVMEWYSSEKFDEKYLDTLPEWEQKWIEKTLDLAGGAWTDDDYEVFQMEHFKAATPLAFLHQLEQNLQSHDLDTGFFNIRVTSVDRVEVEAEAEESRTLTHLRIVDEKDKIKKLRKAINSAAEAMTGEDWTMFHKIWTNTDKRIKEETNRVIKIIQRYIDAVTTKKNSNNLGKIRNRTWFKPAKETLHAVKLGTKVVSKAEFRHDEKYHIASEDGSFVLCAAGQEKRNPYAESNFCARIKGEAGTVTVKLATGEIVTAGPEKNLPHEISDQSKYGGEGYGLSLLDASIADGGNATRFTFSQSSKDSSCRIHSSEHGNKMLFFLHTLFPRELVVWTKAVATDGLWETFNLVWSDDGNTLKIRHNVEFVHCSDREGKATLRATNNEGEATKFRLQEVCHESNGDGAYYEWLHGG